MPEIFFKLPNNLKKKRSLNAQPFKRFSLFLGGCGWSVIVCHEQRIRFCQRARSGRSLFSTPVFSRWRVFTNEKNGRPVFPRVSNSISDLGRDRRTMLGRLSRGWLFPCTLLITAVNDLLFSRTGGKFLSRQKRKRRKIKKKKRERERERERGEKTGAGVEASAHGYPFVPHEKIRETSGSSLFYSRGVSTGPEIVRFPSR